MNERAVNAFTETLDEIEELILALTEAKDDNFGTDPDTLNWGHVGTAKAIRSLLKEALGMVEKVEE